MINEDNERMFWTFVTERQNVFMKRFVDRLPPPWTADPILLNYKFTNVYRELDYGTVYLISEILQKTQYSFADRLFNVLVYRLFNKVETHQKLGFLFWDSYDPLDVGLKLKMIKESGERIFTNAFLTVGMKKAAKSIRNSSSEIENLTEGLIAGIAGNKDIAVSVENATSMEEVWKIVDAIPGFGGFLAYEVACDLNYPPFQRFSWDSFVNIGPGARKGLRILYPKVEEEEMNITDDSDNTMYKMDGYNWRISDLHHYQKISFAKYNLENNQDMRYWQGKNLSLRDIEHSLCEFSKYYRIKQRTGHTRRFDGSGSRIVDTKREEDYLRWLNNTINVPAGQVS